MLSSGQSEEPAVQSITMRGRVVGETEALSGEESMVVVGSGFWMASTVEEGFPKAEAVRSTALLASFSWRKEQDVDRKTQIRMNELLRKVFGERCMVNSSSGLCGCSFSPSRVDEDIYTYLSLTL